MAAEVGKPAPDFALKDTQNNVVSLSDFKGKKTLVVFFPFAFSGICQGELCTIRDNLASLNAVDANVVALSTDHRHSNRAFSEQQGFGFPVLSDFWPHGAVAQAYGCFNPDLGCAMRATYVLDEDGIVRAIVATDQVTEARQFDSYQEALASF